MSDLGAGYEPLFTTNGQRAARFSLATEWTGVDQPGLSTRKPRQRTSIAYRELPRGAVVSIKTTSTPMLLNSDSRRSSVPFYYQIVGVSSVKLPGAAGT